MPPINSDWGLEHKYQTLCAVFAQLRFAAPRLVQRAGIRFVVRGDEQLTAFVELEMAIHAFAVDLIS
jgi:hypothetical protein